MANIDVVDKCGNLSSLIGGTIRAFHHEYTTVALLVDDGDIVNFCADEVSVGKWFEVFPIELTTPPEYEFTWTELKKPFVITGCAQLWREEWQEPVADDGSFLGAGPHLVQCSAPIGDAPDAVSQVVQVNAGVKFYGSNESCMVICSSSSDPFKMDFAIDKPANERILKEHACQ